VIVINFTGLKRIYWLPKIGCQYDSLSLWYFDCRWLGVEWSVYSRAMAAHFIRALNAFNGIDEEGGDA
jgi:hypothetical protein